ncbi:MAG TPA: hypothetical protein VKH15_18850 [Candidatus Acidoferrum sp.]|nr:hypothetical protein [Candidatus Acidoferrum sp.]
MNSKKGSGISRREFARRAAIVSAVSVLPAGSLPLDSASSKPLPPQSPDAPKLSTESQAEADARYEAILSHYRSRFSDTQKADLYRLCLLAQPSLDHLRAYPLENGDGPALYLKPLVEREKKAEPAAPRATSPAAKRP